MRIERDDLSRPVVRDLIAYHLASAERESPPGRVFALDDRGLRDPSVTVWTAWMGDELAGMGALKALDPSHAEVKSMRTAPAHLRKGIARQMLDHLVSEGRVGGYRRLSLETGSSAYFLPARTMYERAGFTLCEPFAGYTDRSFSRYFTLAL